MTFSQRKGYIKVSNQIQKDFMTIELTNRLWNVSDINIWSKFSLNEPSSVVLPFAFDKYLLSLFDKLLKAPLSKKPITGQRAYNFF